MPEGANNEFARSLLAARATITRLNTIDELWRQPDVTAAVGKNVFMRSRVSPSEAQHRACPRRVPPRQFTHDLHNARREEGTQRQVEN